MNEFENGITSLTRNNEIVSTKLEMVEIYSGNTILPHINMSHVNYQLPQILMLILSSML